MLAPTRVLDVCVRLLTLFLSCSLLACSWSALWMQTLNVLSARSRSLCIRPPALHHSSSQLQLDSLDLASMSTFDFTTLSSDEEEGERSYARLAALQSCCISVASGCLQSHSSPLACCLLSVRFSLSCSSRFSSRRCQAQAARDPRQRR